MSGCRLWYLSPLALLLILTVPACDPGTTRPAFTPFPEADTAEVSLPVRQATRRLAELLQADSLPVPVVRERDGFLDTRWFDTTTRHPPLGRGLGQGVVRLRGWIEPARPRHSKLTVELTYRPLADPSLTERERERPLPSSHPFVVRLRALLARLQERER